MLGSIKKKKTQNTTMVPPQYTQKLYFKFVILLFNQIFRVALDLVQKKLTVCQVSSFFKYLKNGKEKIQ